LILGGITIVIDTDADEVVPTDPCSAADAGAAIHKSRPTVAKIFVIMTTNYL
jgi:hypothetical protein